MPLADKHKYIVYGTVAKRGRSFDQQLLAGCERPNYVSYA